MPIKHAYTAVGTNDPLKEVSVDRWNEVHTVDQYLDLPVITDPASPAADLRLYAKSRAGRRMLNMVGPNGVDVGIQPALFGNSIAVLAPGAHSSTAGYTGTGTLLSTNTTTNVTALGASFFGGSSATTATITSPAITATSTYTRMRRILMSTGTAATNQSAIWSSVSTSTTANITSPLVSLPNTGFFMFARFAIDTYVSTSQMFIGLASTYTGTGITADPTTWANSVGITKDTANTTGWIINHRSATTAVPTATGVAFTAGQILDFTAFMPPNGTSITYRLSNAETGAILVNNIAVSGNLPTGPLGFRAHIRSTAGTTAKILALNKFYLETDI
jgi:hypothetical protein